ncbi:hypothetical protein EDD98_1972 [Streptomyces sp. PanSC19]|nr:hypothetical protein EDD98_1972 [Streptomyces sp. PanSC19]
MAGGDDAGGGQDAEARGAQHRPVRGDRVLDGAVRPPPEVAHEGDDALVGAREEGDVLGAVLRAPFVRRRGVPPRAYRRSFGRTP